MSFKFKDLFISYGRRESLGFVGRLHQRLKLAGYEAWFDKVNIPDGDDYAQRINHGIESAHNFVYVMAPRCMTSPYCLIELEYARLLGKRLIPINQLVIFDTPEQELSDGDKQVMVNFYKHHNLPNQNIRTTQDVLNRSHTLIGRTDWLDAKEKLADSDCQRLVEWAQPYENNWAKHDDLDYLKTFDFPVFGQSIDALDGVVERIIAVLERQKEYVHRHTDILAHALLWQQNQRNTYYLLVGKARQAVEEWLLTEFLPSRQPPCQPSTLVCEFICEARKNAENLMTDIFICYDIHHDKAIRNSVVQSLSRYAKTTWTHDRDIQKGVNYECAIEMGIENADNFFYFISPQSVASDYCQHELDHALQYNKRIVPLLIAPTPESDVPEVVRGLQYVDLTDNVCQADYESDIDDIFNILRRDQEYYKQHKVLLARALKWVAENKKPSFLLRGHNLENAQTWLRLNEQREQHPPLALHKELITASEAAKGQLGTEVFISYSRKDGDFARQLNTKLQEAGKTTWFDQESISAGVDFEKEIFKGIDGSDNFLFVLSPDAVESEYCEREVNYAAEQNKRFITVLHRETDPTMMPKALRTIHWIDFKNIPFDKSFMELMQTIELDRKHTHQHTILQQRATDWAENKRSKDFLLNIIACENAESWLETAREENKQPAPTVLQQAFIQDSRKAIKKANRRRNRLLTLATFGMIIAGILAVFTVIQMDNAEKATAKAVEQRQRAESLLLADKARQQTEKGNAANGILLALEALPKDLSAPDRPYSAEAADQLYAAVVELRERLVMEGEHSMWHVAFSPDGQTLVTAGEGGDVRLWKASGQLLHSLKGHSDWVSHAAFAPDGIQLLTASYDGTARLWAVESGQLVHTFNGHDSSVSHAAFAPDGTRVVTASDDGTARLWAVQNGQLLHTLKGHKAKVSHAAFAPDGTQLLTASFDGTAHLWAVQSGQLLHTFKGHGSCVSFAGKVSPAAFAPDGTRLLTASSDGTVRLWAVQSGQLLHTLKGHESSVSHAAFAPDGTQVVTASFDGTARLWAVESGQLLHTLKGHSGWVYHATFAPEGTQVLTASDDGTARLWAVQSGQLLHTFKGHSNKVYHAAFAPDGTRLLTASYDGTARLWAVQSNQLLRTLKGHESSVSHAAFAPDGTQVLTASDDGTARLWAVQSGQLLHTLKGHDSSVSHAAFAPDGTRLLSASIDGTARLWAVQSGQLLHTLKGHNSSVSHAAFAPDGTQLLIASYDGTARIWAVQSGGQLLHTFKGHDSSVSHAVFAPDGTQVVTASDDRTARLWAVQSGQLLHTLKGHSDRVSHASFAPDGTRVVTASDDGTARLWAVQSGQLLHTLKGHSDRVSHAAFAPDGTRLVTASYDGTARLWAVQSGQLLHTLKGHDSSVSHAAFAPDGTRLLTASDDGTARLWTVQSGQQLYTLSGHNGKVSHAAFAPNGTFVVTSAYDKTARLWRVFSTQALIDYANENVPRCLTAEQRKQFFLPESKNEALKQGEALARESQIKAAVVKFKQAKALAPCLKFDPEDQARKIAATALIENGKNLLKEGKIPAAIAEFQQALKVDSRFNGLPLVANHWMAAGRKLAREGQIKAAVAAFKKAKELITSFRFKPETKAKQIFAAALVEKGQDLAKNGEIESAIAKYQQAQQMDSNLEISAETWDSLCWYGSLYGQAAKVMDACEKAVALAPDEQSLARFKLHRGLASVFTSNIQHAIADFQFYREQRELDTEQREGHEEWKSKVQEWIEALQNGENPFTEEVLEEYVKFFKVF
jgi:WD40 repeat protein/tetratricopeptide (TPR) repeat protein